MAEISRIWVTVTANTAGFMRGMDSVTARMTNVGRQMTQIGGQLTRYVTLPIVGVGVAAVKTAMDFEYAMAKIEGLVGISREQLNAWQDDMEGLGKRFAQTPKELADALYFITSAGHRGAVALEILELAAKGNASALGETQEIAKLLSFVINAYGSENITAARAADILTAAIRKGSVEAPELTAALGDVLPIASNMGVEFEQVAAAIAAMTVTGTPAATAAMQLKNILQALIKPGTEAEKVLSDMGTSSEKLRQKIKDDGLLSVMVELKDLTNLYGEELMAKVFPNIRGLLGIMDLMGENMESNIEIFNAVIDSVGMLDAVFLILSETAQFAWDKMKSSISWGLKELGDILLPVVAEQMGGVTEKVIELAEKFAELDKEQQEHYIRMAGYAVVAGPVLQILGNLTIAIAGIIVGIKTIGTMVVALAALLGVPVATIVATIGLIAAAIITVIELWKGMKKLMEDPPIMPGYDPSKPLGSQGPTERWRHLPKNTAVLKAAGAVVDRRHYPGVYPGDPLTSPDAREFNWKGLFMDNGGVVPGPMGAPRLAMVHGGETVLPTHKTGGGSMITLNVTQHIDSQATADYASNSLLRILQTRGNVGALR